ncbi:MAG: PEP/pyruvate-binding domain-containing protein [Myxococcales bacterium]|nr:PEP/pyruvate-binding domain-containing protein [Myxococcales bacterium]
MLDRQLQSPCRLLTLLGLLTTLACDEGGGDQAIDWECTHAGDEAPDFLQQIGCNADFEAVAAQPFDASLPGALTVKTIVDREDENALYFQNSVTYQIHHQFAEAHLSVAADLPPVAPLSEFNQLQYSSSDRRFLLGSLTHYEGPDLWVYEIAPYDRADAEMITLAYDAIVENSFIGEQLLFHPTSVTVEQVVPDLPPRVKVLSTDELYEGVDYQALNTGEAYGQLRFITAEELATEYVSFRDIVVLDHVPNDISVTLGIITSEFQTPLAHINVLSQNRGTPNMALRGAHENEELLALKDKWVHLTVGPFEYSIEETTREEADQFWEENRPSEVQVPGADLSITDLRPIEEAVVYAEDASGEEILAAIKEGTRAFGGKAANFSPLARIEGVRSPQAFAVPIYYYFQFMEENGFDQRVEALLTDAAFQEEPAVRDAELESLRTDMQQAPVNADFEKLLLDKIAADYPLGQRMRFRSSTNAEDLDGFTGAGLYTSRSGDPNDPAYPVLDAVRTVWSSVWYFRAFEERSYRSIDHLAVGMALLVHRSFPEEEANGVALTDNPFDRSGTEPAFYVNVQYGDFSVVMPAPGVTTDQFLYYHLQQGQPTTYISHSSLGEEGETVMNRSQVHELGEALKAVRDFFRPVYGSPGWWAMDVEFKLDGEPGEEPLLYLKQARPFGER